MRMKVKAPDPSAFQVARKLVESSGTLVLQNPKRLTLSVEDPSPALIEALRNSGSTVLPDAQFNIEARAAAGV